MRRSSFTWQGKNTGVSGAQNLSVERLAAQIGQLLRHPAFRRETVVSSLLRRHLPYDAGYAWNGEAALRTRLTAAALDEVSLDHLIRNVQEEFQRLRRPTET